MKTHRYNTTINWTGNLGSGTKSYKNYSRDYTISSNGKTQTISGSSDPAFLGDSSKYNPEELLLSAVSSCHMLWYLHLCATNNIVVTSYTDKATGTMKEVENGSGKFTGITLHPEITITAKADLKLAELLHNRANEMCFIANSLNFKVAHQAVISVEN
ncbi:OsmC family protein [Aurantibacter aestuarii]|uniref:Peroxiredoxin n=1 Tax=Aurantibacter aestuarii TaxID=1266046 RepID=A0A2T1ND97_9FLAO|nr:OsmC family protein [Aurantibacter aestuarii]PSG90396.1 peroxiredoxin [Aurantibacter aestuarii]